MQEACSTFHLSYAWSGSQLMQLFCLIILIICEWVHGMCCTLCEAIFLCRFNNELWRACMKFVFVLCKMVKGLRQLFGIYSRKKWEKREREREGWGRRRMCSPPSQRYNKPFADMPLCTSRNSNVHTAHTHTAEPAIKQDVCGT